MPSDTYPHAVFGFSENLDWSTLHFVKPIDDIRVCSACRVVARKAAFLPCRHVLCEPCYEQWKPTIKVCFLDGDLCPENEVYWREFPVDRMMKYEVRCWNRENGCETITEVSNIAVHFYQDCAYHTTCCARCSSTVLRKNIAAHLESHCVSHMLNAKSTGSPFDGISMELVEFRQGLRGIGLALRTSAQTNYLVPSTLQATQGSHEDNLSPLLTMAAEVKQVSLLIKEALSLVKENCQWSANQAAYFKTTEASLSAELDEITDAAAEWSFSEASANLKKAELEDELENLQLLRREIEVVSSKLTELRNEAYPEAAIAASAIAGGLSEARVSSKATSFDECKFSHRVTVRVFENTLKVPVIALCSVHRRPTSTHTDKESRRWCHVVESSVDDRYTLRVFIHRVNKNSPIQIEIYVKERVHGVFAKPPEKVMLTFIDGKGQVEYDSDDRCAGPGNIRDATEWRLLRRKFKIENQEECLRIDRDQLRICFTFSYLSTRRCDSGVS